MPDYAKLLQARVVKEQVAVILLFFFFFFCCVQVRKIITL